MPKSIPSGTVEMIGMQRFPTVCHGIFHRPIVFSGDTHESLYHAIENTLRHSQIGYNTSEYIMNFLFSDWFYFTWHGINEERKERESLAYEY